MTQRQQRNGLRANGTCTLAPPFPGSGDPPQIAHYPASVHSGPLKKDMAAAETVSQRGGTFLLTRKLPSDSFLVNKVLP
jgi:hypothetical protein